MTLVNLPAINNGDDANDTLFNSRLGALANVINGGIDQENLADSGVSTAKLANQSVTPAKMNLSKAVDANGWTVYDYGSWKEYEKLTVGTPNVSVTAENVYVPPDINLPVGVTNTDSVHVQYSFRCSERTYVCMWRLASPPATLFTFHISNLYPGTTTLATYTIYMRLKDK